MRTRIAENLEWLFTPQAPARSPKAMFAVADKGTFSLPSGFSGHDYAVYLLHIAAEIEHLFSAARNAVARAGVHARAPAVAPPASSPPRPSHHHVHIAAPALRANQPPAPPRHWRLWPIPACPARPDQVRSGDHMLSTRPQAGPEPRRRSRASSAGLGVDFIRRGTLLHGSAGWTQ
jgi:hypothetical protein